MTYYGRTNVSKDMTRALRYAQTALNNLEYLQDALDEYTGYDADRVPKSERKKLAVWVKRIAKKVKEVHQSLRTFSRMS